MSNYYPLFRHPIFNTIREMRPELVSAMVLYCNHFFLDELKTVEIFSGFTDDYACEELINVSRYLTLQYSAAKEAK